MLASVITLFVSFFISALIVRNKHLQATQFMDIDTSGPQKFHTHAVPRIGGVAIFLSLLVGVSIRLTQNWESGFLSLMLLVCCLPTFLMGFYEDISKNVSPTKRLIACIVSAILAYLILDIKVTSVDVEWVDSLLSVPIIAFAISCFMIVGLTNAYNIIDGFNGLVSIVAVITLLAIGYVAFRNDDYSVIFVVVMIVGSIMGFFAFNYPKGLIFLGDGGAYLVGFLIGALSVLLSMRHPKISPWFSLLINIYPIFETLFSIWRKLIFKKVSPSTPDGVHLHMLIYGRVSKWLNADSPSSFRRNSRTSPFLWFLSIMAVFPAVVFWNNTLVLQFFTGLFCLSYIFIYNSIVKFKFQKWIKR